MMTVMIKGMKLPSKGNWITVCIYPNGKCAVLNRQGGYKIINALEIPPHGRLIDADELEGEFEYCSEEDRLGRLLDAPTVIESEEEE